MDIGTERSRPDHQSSPQPTPAVDPAQDDPSPAQDDPSPEQDEPRAEDVATEPPAPGRISRAARFRHLVRFAWPAVAVYVLVRAAGVGAIAIWAPNSDLSFVRRMTRADGMWYIDVALNGYDDGSGDPTQRSNLAFFPLFPHLIRWLDPVLPGDPRAAGLAIAWVASLAAALGIFAVGAEVGGRRVGIMLAAAWGVLPHAIVEQMAYTEGLFTAFAAWSLWGVLRRNWIAAALLCVLAGLTRASATALIPAVCLPALVAVVRGRDGWRPYAAVVAAPLGWLGYMVWVGDRVGRWDGWLHIQSTHWLMTFDGGVTTYEAVVNRFAQEIDALVWVLVVVTIVSAIILFVLSVMDRQPWPLLVYSGLLIITSVGAAGYLNSRARFLLPAFALLLPIATGLARTRVGRAGVIIGFLAALSAYSGGYLLLIWTYSP